VVAGNVAQDLAPDGGWVPGGPSLYAARMALALGARVDLITRLADDYDQSVFDGLNVVAEPGACARYANTYDAHGDRTQLLLAEGDPLDPSAIPAAGIDACMLAPAYHEITRVPKLKTGKLAVSLQGALRSKTGDGRVVHHPEPLTQAKPFISPGTILFLSEEDTADAPTLARYAASKGAIALLTRGYRGAVMFDGSRATTFGAIPASPVDPTGAGDCFAMAFLVRLVETKDLRESCHFALAAGSLAVEGAGIESIPSRAAVEARMERVVA
jgi:sugar/nucleoside kinase (ribokinase family)